MFVLVTGAPGSGKTSSVIARFANETGRPVYYRGIRDLTLPWHELSDDETRDWPDHLPDGALLIVDEAQQLWPVRPSSKSVPPGLSALETHRHRGWDIWFITQEPSLLDSHARKIANEHYHYVRPFGAPFVTEYHSGSGAVSVGSRTDLARCAQKKKGLPKAAWSHYKSAEVHTHKFRPPTMFYVLGALLIAAPLIWWKFFSDFGGNVGSESAAVEQLVDDGGASVPVGGGDGSEKKSWRELLTPEIRGLPWTAPLYDGIARSPTVVPKIGGCIHPPRDPRNCSCFTQQGTKIFDMPWQICAAFVRDGMFDHLAQAEGAGREGRDGAAGPPSRPAQQGLEAVFLRDSTPRPSRTL